MTVDKERLREVVERHAGLVGFNTADLVDWRLKCAPGAVLALLDDLDRLSFYATTSAAEAIDMLQAARAEVARLKALALEACEIAEDAAAECADKREVNDAVKRIREEVERG